MTDKKMIVWFNLIIGFYNLYLYSVGDNLFNLIIGALNIGVWVFFSEWKKNDT
tara:strand:+ start:291 stop:449 length:159 start_codon:yes stop_codon:yes gene_type:complete